jgi:putative membrane-bound dehydrogenase-like protein
MRSISPGFCRVVLAFAGSLLLFAPRVAGEDFVFDDRTFTVPDGFVIERVSDPSLVQRPITCDFDELGRLYVADSSGSNEPVAKQLADKPHRIVRLEDSDGDGRFDKQTVFADKLMFPAGTMWLDGSLYVAAPPSIWKLTDTDGDGVADRREEWFQGRTLTGCANDLHGPYRGRDGWIYWCKGAFAEQTYDLPGKKNWKTRAAHIFRARPDGTGIEPVMTGGMDNPVDVVFTPEGERLFSCTFLQHPAGGRRDGIIHAIYGGVYGKEHSVLDGHARTGELMPVMKQLGPAAPCGLHYVESTQLGDDWRGNLLCCQFNLRKVSRHKLIPDGATFRTEDSELLTSTAMDFHPTDVIEDADGSVIVCDTGGWYKLCCPTSQFHRPEALGAIYRVRRRSAAKVDDPRGLKIPWTQLAPGEVAKYFDEPRPCVRQRAIASLAARAADAQATLTELFRKPTSDDARIAAVWTCCRIDEPWARSITRDAIGDRAAAVRHAAIHATSLWRDRAAAGRLGNVLATDAPPLVRAAAEAYGRLAGKDNDAATDRFLLGYVNRADDRVMEHSLIYAAIESNNADAANFAFDVGGSRVRRAALFALDGMGENRLGVDRAYPHLKSDDSLVRDAAWAIAEHHVEWGDRLAELFERQLRSTDQLDADLSRRLGRLANNARVRQLILTIFEDESVPDAARRVALAAMAQAPVKPIPNEWLRAVLASIERRRLTADCLGVLGAQSIERKQATRVNAALAVLGVDAQVPDELRLQAFSTIVGTIDELSPAAFAFLRTRLNDETPAVQRSSAVAVLARSKLTSRQFSAVLESMTALGPFDVARLLPLFEQTTDASQQAAALTALESTRGAAQLSAAALRPFVEKLPAALRARGDKLLLRANANLEQQHAKLESLLAAIKQSPGDVQRGRTIFHGKKVSCVSCHAIAYVGGQIGPDLTRVGQIRTQRDLVEAIAFPSASFVRSYEPVSITTTDGRQVSGLVRSESATEMVIIVAADKIERIPREDVETMRPGTVSVMPQGLDQQLSTQELADLVAFLQSCR